DGGSDPVRREDDQAALRNLLDAADENCAELAKLVDDVGVVDDLLPDEDGRPVLREGALDGLHRSLDSRAVSTRRRAQHPLEHPALHHPAKVASPHEEARRLKEPSTGQKERGPPLGGSWRRTLSRLLTAGIACCRPTVRIAQWQAR